MESGDQSTCAFLSLILFLFTHLISRYMKTYKNGLYVYYKEKSEGSSDMTCSEAHGIIKVRTIYKIAALTLKIK